MFPIYFSVLNIILKVNKKTSKTSKSSEFFIQMYAFIKIQNCKSAPVSLVCKSDLHFLHFILPNTNVSLEQIFKFKKENHFSILIGTKIWSFWSNSDHSRDDVKPHNNNFKNVY